ncbi:hypothetical protein Tco_0500613 [Tanacetum coccineum]
MDKSWMYRAPRASSQYVSDCHNRFYLKRALVYDRLICVGFKRGYLNWTDHEESHEVPSSSMMENDEDEDNDHEMHGLCSCLSGLLSYANSIFREHNMVCSLLKLVLTIFLRRARPSPSYWL